MSKLSRLLLLATVAGMTAFGAYYWFSVAPVRAIMYRENPEMGWLRSEYHLDDVQFDVISRLHRDYAPRCKVMCARVAAGREAILKLTAENRGVTPELAAALQNMSALETECRSAMLAHVYTVAAVMNPADGRRYLETMIRDIVAAPGAQPQHP